MDERGGGTRRLIPRTPLAMLLWALVVLVALTLVMIFFTELGTDGSAAGAGLGPPPL